MKSKYISSLILSFFLIFNFLFLNAQEIEFLQKFEIGSEEKQEEILFKITEVKADRDGNIFIVDYGNNCIKKFSFSGKFLKEVGRKGQGPREMINPLNIDIDQEGNIYVNDRGNRRINVYDNDLNYLRTIKLDNSISIENFFILPEDKLLVFRSARVIEDEYFYLFSNKGEYIKSFYNKFHPYVSIINSSKDIQSHLLTFVYLASISNLNQDKTQIACAYSIPQNPYEIYLMDTNGNVIEKIKKEIKNYNPQKQKKILGYIISKNKDKLDDRTAIIMMESLHFTKENFLVVQRKDELYNQGSFDKFLISLDIFSSEGDLIKEEMEISEKISSIDMDNNVYTIIEDEQGISKVGVYKLKIKR